MAIGTDGCEHIDFTVEGFSRATLLAKVLGNKVKEARSHQGLGALCQDLPEKDRPSVQAIHERV